MVIVVKVVYNLSLLYDAKIDITSLSSPSKIIELRKYILVLKPTFIC